MADSKESKEDVAPEEAKAREEGEKYFKEFYYGKLKWACRGLILLVLVSYVIAVSYGWLPLKVVR